MGNTAIVKPANANIGVYLHWDGGLEWVSAFLRYCELKGYRDFGGKNIDSYGIAYFVRTVANFFEDGTSIGIITITDNEAKEKAECYDNGIYVIDGWKIKEVINGRYREIDHEDLIDRLIQINMKQPDPLKTEYICAKRMNPANLRIGDIIYVYRAEDRGNICERTITQIVSGIPMTNDGRRITHPVQKK